MNSFISFCFYLFSIETLALRTVPGMEKELKYLLCEQMKFPSWSRFSWPFSSFLDSSCPRYYMVSSSCVGLNYLKAATKIDTKLEDPCIWGPGLILPLKLTPKLRWRESIRYWLVPCSRLEAGRNSGRALLLPLESPVTADSGGSWGERESSFQKKTHQLQEFASFLGGGAQLWGWWLCVRLSSVIKLSVVVVA